MRIPSKPFPNYKWRWAVLTPTESLNDPPVFFGVLRALRAHEGEPPNSKDFIESLRIVEAETKTPVDLVRTPERNLIRNSGQYWKALDLLGDTSGEIYLTGFGERVADGVITKAEFASTVVKTLELPNFHFESDIDEWKRAWLAIKPLELILQIVTKLQETLGLKHGYLTPNELIKIVIPLAGSKATLDEYIQSLNLHRAGRLNISSWPDCAPASNDKRMAREFLYFLANYNFFSVAAVGASKYDYKYVFPDADLTEVNELISLRVAKEKPENIVKKVRKTGFPAAADRKRVMTEILTRPNQPYFRSEVLDAFSYKCLLTGVSLSNVLEAAHIIPVSEKGEDLKENGLCLRSDMHLLFDSGHLRIDTRGIVHLTEEAATRENYASLPKKIAIPRFVNLDFIDWRWKYY